MQNINQVILSDKIIDSESLVVFIRNCLRETGGIQSVPTNLRKSGFGKFEEMAYPKLDDAKKTGVLNLESYSSTELNAACKVITDTLIDYDDLETLMCINESQAKSFLEEISTSS